MVSSASKTANGGSNAADVGADEERGERCSQGAQSAKSPEDSKPAVQLTIPSEPRVEGRC